VDNPVIGVFDSGVGGLTVLAALQKRLPRHRYIYLGDTARLPYGTKSADTVTRYALQAARHLIEQTIDSLVVACNTASAQALTALRARYPGLSIFGVVDAGALLAAQTSRTGRIAVLSTEGTARTEAYGRAIAACRPEARVISVACALLVALAEEGWHEGPIAEAIVRRYVEPLFVDDAAAPDTIVLGCTHFPLLASTIRKVVGDTVSIVESGDAVAAGLAGSFPNITEGEGATTYQVTDSPERFAQIAGRFLGHRINATDIQLVEL
jgi:glutamate racemase